MPWNTQGTPRIKAQLTWRTALAPLPAKRARLAELAAHMYDQPWVALYRQGSAHSRPDCLTLVYHRLRILNTNVV